MNIFTFLINAMKNVKIDLVFMIPFVIPFSTTLFKKVEEKSINDYYNDNENLQHFIQKNISRPLKEITFS